jgi:hypothetical protein
VVQRRRPDRRDKSAGLGDPGIDGQPVTLTGRGTGDRRQQTGDRRQEAGGGRQEVTGAKTCGEPSIRGQNQDK